MPTDSGHGHAAAGAQNHGGRRDDRRIHNVENPEADGERLQKVLAAAGVASRRASEDLITAGQVSVNGHIVRQLGTRVHPERDRIRVHGVPIQTDLSKVYYMLNKPGGVVSTMKDERGRPDLSRYADDVGVRIFNVGRLDEATTGLLVLTNDGELAHRLAHPSFEVSKVYVARIAGRIDPATARELEAGIELNDGPIVADKVHIVDTFRNESLVEVRIHSGRNRIVRRMLSAVGHPVVHLMRKQFGPLHLGTLRLGEMRELTTVERGQILKLSLRTDHAARPPEE